MTDKQVGGICGAALTNLSGWLSGIWFDHDPFGCCFSASDETALNKYSVDNKIC